MRALLVVVASCAIGLVSGCGPTFNWRETAIGDTRLAALFPCKPEVRQRPAVLAQRQVELTMRSCETAGVTFAIGHLQLGDGQPAEPVLAHWRVAMLSGMRVDPVSVSTQAPQRLQALPQLVATRGVGKAANGDPLNIQGLWFAQGPQLFMAILFAGDVRPDVAETFFSGLHLR